VTALRLVLVVLAAAAGGAVNAIAGGGTLITFPTIVALGLDPRIANATSTVALWPGSASSMWGYRDELRGAGRWIRHLTLPSLVGGAIGAWLLLRTSSAAFARIVPFLVLGATVLFFAQGPLMRRIRGPAPLEGGARVPLVPLGLFYVLQCGVAVYGGYFGAGAGILMLAELGLMGLTNIHTMNGVKNWAGLCLNFVAATAFALNGVVDWPVALAMAAGGLAGGYGGSRLAQRVGQQRVRHAVVAVGLLAFVWLLLRRK